MLANRHGWNKTWSASRSTSTRVPHCELAMDTAGALVSDKDGDTRKTLVED